ncbi:unnamed protein product [Calypogeia fissa]
MDDHVEAASRPKRMAAGARGVSRWSVDYSASERSIKMESVIVPKVLQELLLSLPSLPKENNGKMVTFVTQDLSNGARDADCASGDDIVTHANFLDHFPEVLNMLVMLLTRDDNPAWQLRALQALEGLLATSDANMKAKIVHCPGALTGLLVLLASDNNRDFQVRSALIIRLLATGDIETKAKISSHPGVLHGLVVSLTKDSNPSLQQNTARALSFLALGENDNVCKVLLKYVLKGTTTPLENEFDSDDLLLDCLDSSENLVAGGGLIKAKRTRDVLTNVHVQDMRLRIQRMQMEMPSLGEVLESFDTFFQDFEETLIKQEEEIQVRDQTTTIDIDIADDTGKAYPRCVGCYSLRPLLWLSRLFGKRKVAAVLEIKLDDASSHERSLGRRPEVQVRNRPLPLDTLSTLLSQVFQAKELPQQRKALRALCDRTQAPLDTKAVPFLAENPAKALKGLVNLLASPFLRGLARLALKNLVAFDREIAATTVGLLFSLMAEPNPLQEGAVWGLGSLAADSDGVKAEIVNEPGALKCLVGLLKTDTNYTVRGTTAMVLRNLAAGDGTMKAIICNYPGALDALVCSLTVDGEIIELSWNINFELQNNAALALGYLASGRRMKSMIVDHPGALAGLVTALTNLWSPALQQNAAFALGNLAGGDGLTKAIILDYPGLLLGLTFALKKDRNRSPALQQHAAFALGNLAGGFEHAKTKILDHPLVLQFVMASLNETSNPALQVNAARALGILGACGDRESDTKSKIVNNKGVREGLMLSSLNHDNLGMRRHLKWASKNLGAIKDVENMGNTKVFNDLWKSFSTPGASPPRTPPQSKPATPSRADIFGS